MMMGHRKVLTEMTGQVGAMQGLSVWEYTDRTCETLSADHDAAWMSGYDGGMYVSRVASGRGTSATRGEEKGEAFGGTLRMA